MNPTKNRCYAIAIIVAILGIVLFGVYYVQTTMREVESSLPIQVINEKSALTTLTQNLGYLTNSISDLKDVPNNSTYQQNVLDDLLATQKQLTYVRETFRFENLLGAASIHAVVFPALFDIDNWLKDGIHDLDPNSPVVLQLLHLRSTEAFVQSRDLDDAANTKAANIMINQSESISQFRTIATVGLIAFVLLTLWLVALIWNQLSISERLFNSDFRFREFANITSDFLWETDKDLKTTYLSAKFEKLTGLPSSKALGKTLRPSLFDEQNSNDNDDKFIQAFQSDQQVNDIPLQFLLKNGTKKYLRVDAKPIRDATGKLQGYRGGVKDLTELNTAVKTAEEMKEVAETASQAKTNFLANMSHEIRSPIAIVTGMTGLLLESIKDPGHAKYLRIIEDSSESLLTLINRILDVAKIESNKISLSLVSFNLHEMADNIRIAYSEISKNKDVQVNLKIDHDVKKIQVGDKFRIEQVLRNLVDNAVKFTEKGEINIHISNHSDPGKIMFSVSDTGPGIAEKKQQEMFEPFIQEDESTSRKYGGTGLGLAICKQLVERMGGELWLKSQPGKGSRFNFTIATSQEIKPIEVEKEDSENSVAEADNLKILLAEDDPIMAMIFQENLRETGHLITHANNGKEALAEFLETEFDIVFMDIHMPEVDGYTAVAQMREHSSSGHNSGIPIVALSASVLSSDIDRCLQAGFTTHIGKPFVKETLLAEITSLGQRKLLETVS